MAQFALKTSMPAYLRDEERKIEAHARAYGLDFFPTMFEVLSYDHMNEIAAYGGFPSRYPHWRFGMHFEELKKSSEYGLSTIYEMVINNNPAVAYLLEGNSMVDQKLVMAHVYGHVDFFKNNFAFSSTDQGREAESGEPIRKWIDAMANHGAVIRRWANRVGIEKIEAFVDDCLSLENLIDPHRPLARKAKADALEEPNYDKPGEELPRLRVDRDYMASYINPDEFMEAQRKKVETEATKAKKMPEEPDRDVMGFLLEHAPLEPWERDVLAVIRREAYYFAPQAQTKIMNEGWATYWHSKILTEKAADGSEIIDYADRCAGVLATSRERLNPYKLGVELYRHIEERWNRGQFGKEWDECDDLATRQNWDRRLGLGRKKIFEVRSHYTDVTFIDEFLTPEFAIEQKLFSFGYNAKNDRFEVESRKFEAVKQRLLFQLTNAGNPIVHIEDANHKNRGELLLMHDHQGIDLKQDYAQAVLVALERVWRRPVELRTLVEGKVAFLRFDGNEHKVKNDQGKGELEQPLFQLVFFAAVVLAVWPLFSRGYLPIEDLPQHLAAVRVLHSYHDLRYGFERYFELQLFRTQYLAYYVLCDWLSYVMDLELANRVLMIASAMATPYALWYLLRALGRSPWLALFALPLTYNAHLILGFVNFLIAIPLALFGLGLAIRQHTAPTRRRGVALAGVGVVCFLSHVVPFALLALGCALIAVDRTPAVACKRLAPLLPAALVSLVWLFASPAGFSTVSAVQGGLGSVKAQYQPADVAWRDLPNWLTDTLHGDEDLHVLMGYAGLLLCTVLAGVVAAAVRRARASRDGKPQPGAWPLSWRLLPLAPLCLILYFVTPSAYDWIWPIAQRFPLLALLFAIPVLPPPPRAWIALAVCVLLTLTFLQERCVARAFDSFQQDEVGDFDRALAAIPPQKRVMGLIYGRWSRNVKFAAFIHFVAYYQARKGGAVMFTFADFPQSPFRFRESNRPPRVPPRWEWLPHLVQASDLSWYEYLLTRGAPAPCAGTCQEVYRGSMWSAWKLK